MFRPFVKLYHYTEKILNHRLTDNHYKTFGEELENKNQLLCFNVSGKDFYILASHKNVDLHFTGDCQYIPLYRYDKSGNRLDNITDWGLQQFVNHYNDKKIQKEDIFHYTYAVLHNPAYRQKYELNLKREFPRLPFYDNFWKWTNWGKALMDLHIGYESAEPSDLKEHHKKTKQQKEKSDKEPQDIYALKPKVKPKLKADKKKGTIEIDELTSLTGVPKAAWEYKLGNRSAPEWILDQYKEKKPRDPTIAEKFNTYCFADYKTHVIDLLRRVCTVSVETMNIIEEMKNSGEGESG